MSKNPMTSPSTGEMTMNAAILRKPVGMMASQPAFMTAAPANPPISACDELVGRPMYQVRRSQKIAPRRPPRSTAGSTTPGWITRFAPMVVAIFDAEAERRGEIEERRPHHRVAGGERTRVWTPRWRWSWPESWKPLMKSEDEGNADDVTAIAEIRIQLYGASAGQAFFTMMPSITFATSSHLSVANSAAS